MSDPRRRRLGGVIAAATALVMATGLAAPAATAAPGPRGGDAPADRPDFTLTILHNNDGESALLGREVAGEPYGSVSRFKSLLAAEERAATRGRPPAGQVAKRGVTVVSAGDNFLPGPQFAASLEEGAPIYDALAVARMDYDVSALGNHDFDFGPDLLAEFIREDVNRTPYLKTNLDVSAEPSLQRLVERRRLVDTVLVRERGESIGFIGLTTPELPQISSPRGVAVLTDLAGIVNAEAAGLERRGVDKILLVSHLQDIDKERALVPQLRGVDVVVGGGGGELLAAPGDVLIPGDVADGPYPYVETDADGMAVPVVTTTGNWEYLGRLVVTFSAAGDVLSYDAQRSGTLRVSGAGDDAVPQDRFLRERVEDPVADYVEGLAEDVVATSEVALNGVRGDVRSRETNLGNLVADALRWSAGQRAAEFGTVVPQVGIQNGGGIRNDSIIPAGDITALDTYSIAPFGNFVSVVPEVPRETFRQLLERGVSGLPDAAGQFTQVSGMSFSYDVTRTAQEVVPDTGEITVEGERIVDAVLNDGTVVVAAGAVVAGPPISVATNDFSARGGDSYPLAGLPFTTVGTTYQSALQDYLESPEGLGGRVSAADYPEGGEGRIRGV